MPSGGAILRSVTTRSTGSSAINRIASAPPDAVRTSCCSSSSAAATSRITSYNVCYTKLLRRTQAWTTLDADGVTFAPSMRVNLSAKNEEGTVGIASRFDTKNFVV